MGGGNTKRRGKGQRSRSLLRRLLPGYGVASQNAAEEGRCCSKRKLRVSLRNLETDPPAKPTLFLACAIISRAFCAPSLSSLRPATYVANSTKLRPATYVANSTKAAVSADLVAPGPALELRRRTACTIGSSQRATWLGLAACLTG